MRAGRPDKERTPATVRGDELRSKCQAMLKGPRPETPAAVLGPESWRGYEVAVLEILAWLSERAEGGGTV